MATTAQATKTTEPKKVNVILHSNDRENNETEMVVGLNGKLHQIKVGVEVEIDERLLGVIKDALETKYESVEDKKGQLTGEVIEKKKPRYIVEKV